jgi:hypothetical protein
MSNAVWIIAAVDEDGNPLRSEMAYSHPPLKKNIENFVKR